MLRITCESTGEGELRVLLEGRLAGPWVDELRRISALASEHGARLKLDLSSLGFADADGLALLRELLGAAAELERASAFVSALLAEARS
jgi:hypothetical protein